MCDHFIREMQLASKLTSDLTEELRLYFHWPPMSRSLLEQEIWQLLQGRPWFPQNLQKREIQQGATELLPASATLARCRKALFLRGKVPPMLRSFRIMACLEALGRPDDVRSIE